MTGTRVGVLHGVNLDQLGRRPPEHYPPVTLAELEIAIGRFARELGLTVTFDQTNHEGEFCETLHTVSETADALILNPGAWTHYSYAIRDALEITGLPAVEVHLSAIEQREEWRRKSVIGDLCIARISGKGVDGYREALELLADELGIGR
ncbi:MAG: 3-dehydroquinate dehydratase [Thermoleophilaceae bacterium]|jgi:3-dehydroquinate dehydratase-2|nr:3-dehydroquinate dehydratase [Thermoleophilaceae bacterium]